MLAVTTVKRKLFTKTGVDSCCSSCHKTITSESGRGLRNNVTIVTMPSMKNVFQNTIRSTFPFLKMEMNFSVTCYKVKPSESSRPSNEKWEEEESDCDEYGDDINELFSL